MAVLSGIANDNAAELTVTEPGVIATGLILSACTEPRQVAGTGLITGVPGTGLSVTVTDAQGPGVEAQPPSPRTK